MEFKKCSRCGSFFVSDGNICSKCSIKDEQDIKKLKNYIEENENLGSLEELSNNTGITVRNLSRYINNNEEIKNMSSNIKINNNESFNNLSVNL